MYGRMQEQPSPFKNNPEASSFSAHLPDSTSNLTNGNLLYGRWREQSGQFKNYLEASPFPAACIHCAALDRWHLPLPDHATKGDALQSGFEKKLVSYLNFAYSNLTLV
jgi:hypothetical protein